MIKSLRDYREITGDKVISKIYQQTRSLLGKRIVHINSTLYGGGVAEILNSLVPLMNDVGLETSWHIIRGNPDFFIITKKFHNALQGDRINLTSMKKKIYLQINEAFSAYNHINHDCVIIHDPQPLPLINYYRKVQPWIWRCHIDLSHPNQELWDYLKGFVLKYDIEIVSHKNYKNNLPVDHKIIHPGIDPLTSKNKDLGSYDIKKTIKKFKIPTDKPLITQISRFDKWKDPAGVIDVFKKVRKKIDCRLILCGSMASDDPEGIKIYEQVKCRANDLVEKGDVILIASENNILVNVLQRESAVIIQKSLREGFGLTVTEALWKGTPVVASDVGGIPLQIIDGKNGFLVDPKDSDGFADRILELLKNPKLSLKLGKAAKEYVRERFLITRILQDYVMLLNEIL